ncbi:hypothetical protein C1884_16065 [Pseudomonas sp. GW460-R15]|nr:hypothetical protein C1887_06150 [Pseudomonas sp. GW456-R21]POA66089.1 hypothetical protein C1884_16065 [Pseudomonas sp. GW460-R15]
MQGACPDTHSNLFGPGEWWLLWRGGLPPLECEALPEPASAARQIERISRFYDCCAAERGQAPSPQR